MTASRSAFRASVFTGLALCSLHGCKRAPSTNTLGGSGINPIAQTVVTGRDRIRSLAPDHFSNETTRDVLDVRLAVYMRFLTTLGRATDFAEHALQPVMVDALVDQLDDSVDARELAVRVFKLVPDGPCSFVASAGCPDPVDHMAQSQLGWTPKVEALAKRTSEIRKTLVCAVVACGSTRLSVALVPSTTSPTHMVIAWVAPVADP